MKTIHYITLQQEILFTQVRPELPCTGEILKHRRRYYRIIAVTLGEKSEEAFVTVCSEFGILKYG